MTLRDGSASSLLLGLCLLPVPGTGETAGDLPSEHSVALCLGSQIASMSWEGEPSMSQDILAIWNPRHRVVSAEEWGDRGQEHTVCPKELGAGSIFTCLQNPSASQGFTHCSILQCLRHLSVSCPILWATEKQTLPFQKLNMKSERRENSKSSHKWIFGHEKSKGNL